MSLFAGLDVAGADDLTITPDTYACVISNVEAKLTKGNPEQGKLPKLGMTIVYTITYGPKKGLSTQEWKWLPRPEDAEANEGDKAKALSFLKARLEGLGIPEDRMNTLEPDDLIGLECLVTVKPQKNNPEYTTVGAVKRSTLTDSHANSVTRPSVGGNPFS